MFAIPPLPPTFDAALRDVTAKGDRFRAAAARALGNPPDERIDEARVGLMTLATDEHVFVRLEAVGALDAIGQRGADVFEVLEAQLDDPHPTVRQAALVGLTHTDQARARAFVLRAVQGDDEALKLAAALALREYDDPEPLRSLLRDGTPEVRMVAAQSLGDLADNKETLAPLVPLLLDLDRDARFAAAVALGQAGDERATKVLVSGLEQRDQRFAAVTALGFTGADEAREPLAKIAESFLAPLVTKAAASASLVRLGDPRGVPGLRAVLGAWRSDGRAFAVELAGELRVDELLPELRALRSRPRGVAAETIEIAIAAIESGAPS